MTDSKIEVNNSPRFIKLVIVGDVGIGKTSLLIRYASGVFPTESSPTVFDGMATPAQVPGIGTVYLAFSDTAGHEDYDRLRPLSYPGVDIILVCFSVARPASLDNVQEKWIQELRHHLPKVPIILVGCQTDLRNDREAMQELRKSGYHIPTSFDKGTVVALRIGAVNYVECSSLLGDGVTEVFETAVRTAVLEPVRTSRRRKGARCVVA
ncbi:GTP-binding protein of the rho subfamily of ras-like protein [Flagelloscypha sp. PMI_526]|nr:GTP-binding protein of the rho subfamily of ras-like protein [Flagelloscypha sp. PMI_526]